MILPPSLRQEDGESIEAAFQAGTAENVAPLAALRKRSALSEGHSSPARLFRPPIGCSKGRAARRSLLRKRRHQWLKLTPSTRAAVTAIVALGGENDICLILKIAHLGSASTTVVGACLGWAPLARVQLRGSRVEVIGSYARQWTHLSMHSGLGVYDSSDPEIAAAFAVFLIDNRARGPSGLSRLVDPLT